MWDQNSLTLHKTVYLGKDFSIIHINVYFVEPEKVKIQSLFIEGN